MRRPTRLVPLLLHVAWIHRERLAPPIACAVAIGAIVWALPSAPPAVPARRAAPAAWIDRPRLIDGALTRGPPVVAELGDRATERYALALDAADLDGDGDVDPLSYRVELEHDPVAERTSAAGFLVTERSDRALDLGSADGWGGGERIVHLALRDLAGTPAVDLLAVLSESVPEVGEGGHRIVLVTFGSGRATVALDVYVATPVLSGLPCHAVGGATIGDREISVRTVIHDPRCAEPLCVHVETERWSRSGESFVRSVVREPLRASDGGIVTQLEGAPPCEPSASRRWRIDGAWVEAPSFDDERYEDLLDREPPDRASASRTERRDWRDWIALPGDG
jgi:hypothetical protein